MPVESILFVCHGNTCRSVLAEHLAKRDLPNLKNIKSAGIYPGTQNDAENAVFTLSKCGIDASAHVPRNVKELNVSEFDMVVTLDKSVAKHFKNLHPDVEVTEWSIADPLGYGSDKYERYDKCALAILGELKKLKRSLES